MTPERIKYLAALEKIAARKYKWELDDNGLFVRMLGTQYYFDTGFGDEPEDITQIMFSNPKVKPSIVCPFCCNTTFTITYGEYECFANCQCGHKMSIYSG